MHPQFFFFSMLSVSSFNYLVVLKFVFNYASVSNKMDIIFAIDLI